jgi:hypothetical protein
LEERYRIILATLKDPFFLKKKKIQYKGMEGEACVGEPREQHRVRELFNDEV